MTRAGIRLNKSHESLLIADNNGQNILCEIAERSMVSFEVQLNDSLGQDLEI